MATYRSRDELADLGAQASQLRLLGKSRREIQAQLNIRDDLAKALLKGVPVPASLRRSRAKDGARAAAVELRLRGLSYSEIASQLGISKSSCSLWLRALPRPADDPKIAECSREVRLTALRERLRRDRDARDAEAEAVVAAVAQSLGTVSARDVVIAFAVSYWCEGFKRKPWNRAERISWMNSDPELVAMFMEGLNLFGVDRDRLRLTVHIHASADEAAARRFWAVATGVDEALFMRSTIKRHNPKTVRHNIGSSYRGCLNIRVLQSRLLYQVVEGVLTGLAQPQGRFEWHDGDQSLRAAIQRSALV